jgi:hypothetical protein
MPFLTGGIERIKPTPRLAVINTGNFQREIDWLRTFLNAVHGRWITHVMLCPYLERWYLYNDKTLIAMVPHDLVEQLYGVFLLRTAEDDYTKEFKAIIARTSRYTTE